MKATRFWQDGDVFGEDRRQRTLSVLSGLAITVIILMVACILSACSTPAPATGAGGIRPVTGSDQRSVLEALDATALGWSTSPVQHYGTAHSTTAGWYALIPAAPDHLRCGWEIRATDGIGPICEVNAGASHDVPSMIPVTVTGHGPCAGVTIGGYQYVWCQGTYRTVLNG